MFRGLVFCLLLAASQAHSQGTNHDTGRKTNADPNSAKSELQLSDLSAIKDQIHNIAVAIESQKSDQRAEVEDRRVQENIDIQRNMARSARTMLCIAAFETLITALGVLLVAFTLKAARRSADAAENSVMETRRIGEAQVRAYVKIKAVTITFMDNWVPNDAYPNVKIVAANTGQSPALNFVWQPTIQYISGNQWRQRELGGNWANMLGVTISASNEHNDAALIADMPMVKFAASAHSPSNEVLIRVRIDFAFTDVFDRRINGESYFSGVATTYHTTEGPKWRDVYLDPLHKLQDWDDSRTFQKQ